MQSEARQTAEKAHRARIHQPHVAEAHVLGKTPALRRSAKPDTSIPIKETAFRWFRPRHTRIRYNSSTLTVKYIRDVWGQSHVCYVSLVASLSHIDEQRALMKPDVDLATRGVADDVYVLVCVSDDGIVCIRGFEFAGQVHKMLYSFWIHAWLLLHLPTPLLMSERSPCVLLLQPECSGWLQLGLWRGMEWVFMRPFQLSAAAPRPAKQYRQAEPSREHAKL